MSDVKIHLSTLHAEAQSKYVYFLLAGTGAALAYGLQKLDGAQLTWWIAPGIIALLMWLSSLLAGCRYLITLQGVMHHNMDVVMLKEGTHPRQPASHASAVHLIAQINAAMDRAQLSAVRLFRWQFRTLATGIVCFTAWRIIEMARASLA